MLNEHRIGALLLMSGQGMRFGSDIPKQFHRLSGKPVYRVTLEAFLSTGFIDEIVLSCHPDWITTVQEELSLMKLPIPVQITPGGKTRQESSFKGLFGFQTPPSIVLIHDSVRPFVSGEILRNNALSAIDHGAVDTCIPSTDTLVHSPHGSLIESIPNRAEFYRGQTPQSFSYPLILRAHQTTTRSDSSDDCKLVMELGHPVFLVKGEEHNLKITSELDLFLAEQLFRLRKDPMPTISNSLEGKRYAVVGGTGGIGAAICQAIRQKDGIVIPLSRNTSPALDLQDTFSIQETFSTLGPLDGLINCAGFLLSGALTDLSHADIEKMLDINLKGVVFCCKAANLIPNGHIINIASSSFTRGRKDTSIYSCAKAGVVNFTQALAEERPNLFIHTVIPQRTQTQMRLTNFPHDDPHHLLSPEQVAQTVLRLLMDRSSTGMLVEVKK